MDPKEFVEIMVFIHDHEKAIHELAELFRDVEKVAEYCSIMRIGDFIRGKI